MTLFPSRYNYFYKINNKYSFINNILTGAIDFIENDIWNLTVDNKFEEIGKYPLSNLIERGYFYDDLKKEEYIFSELYRNYIKKAIKRPVRFVFCPTYECNLRCSYCFEKDLLSHSNKHMDEAMLDAAIDSAQKISKDYSGEIKSIELFGGEPLLSKNKFLIKKILDFAENTKAAITVVTNGVNADNFIDIFKSLSKQIDMFQITVDGVKEIHDKRRKYASGKGSFDEISKSIDALLLNGINTNIRINIDNSNIEYLPDLFDYVKNKKWFDSPNFNIKPSIVADHSSLGYNEFIIPEEELLRKLISVYDKYPELEELFGFYIFKPLRHVLEIINGAPNASPKFFNCESNIIELNVFCPDGYIYVCPESIGKEEFAIGSFYPELKFNEDKKGMWSKRDIFSIEKCTSCRFAPICGGGCSYSSMLIYKKNMEPVCQRFKETLDVFMELRGEKILKKFLT
ncbi:radical SAM protein [bacterium]|nr:radical SAM protein [bacterium]